MLSILIPIRNAPEMATLALQSTLQALVNLRLEARCEFVLVDDASEPGCDIPALIERFRRAVPQIPVQAFRFRQRQHYTHAIALGMSAARGDPVLLISHDMLVPPAYIRTLLAVAALHPAAGVIRGTSAHIDGLPQHVVHPPVEAVDITKFGQFMAEQFGLSTETDEFVIGDSILITRQAIDKVGVFDTRYVGFLGDMDFGLRVRRAGLKLLCAKGAWLHHEGAGAFKSDAVANRADSLEYEKTHPVMAKTAYDVFRAKWLPSLPQEMNYYQLPFTQLCGVASQPGGEYCPPIAIDPAVVERL